MHISSSILQAFMRGGFSWYLYNHPKMVIRATRKGFVWDTYPVSFKEAIKETQVREKEERQSDCNYGLGYHSAYAQQCYDKLPPLPAKIVKALIRKNKLIEIYPDIWARATDISKQYKHINYKYRHNQPTIMLKQESRKKIARRKREKRLAWMRSGYQGNLPYDYFDNVENPIVSTGHPKRGKNSFTLLDKKKQRKYNRAISKRNLE